MRKTFRNGFVTTLVLIVSLAGKGWAAATAISKGRRRRGRPAYRPIHG